MTQLLGEAFELAFEELDCPYTADSGEDAIVFSTGSDYAANVETAEALAPAGTAPAPAMSLTKVDTPTQKTIEDICAFLKVNPEQ